MNPNKCIKCDTDECTPVHITQINDDGSIETFHMCDKCGAEYIDQLSKNKSKKVEDMPQMIDLSHISSPEELLNFITSLKPKRTSTKEPCSCGMTEEEFDDKGRFGCQQCYNHFSNKMKELVFPFHQANSHDGKKPKKHYIESLMQDPVEKEKILKLRYAKALELENYEQAKIIKEELEAMKSDRMTP